MSLTFNQHDAQYQCRLAFDADICEPAGVRDLLDGFTEVLAATSRHPSRPLIVAPGVNDAPAPTSRR